MLGHDQVGRSGRFERNVRAERTLLEPPELVNITFIPKKEGVTTIQDYRPISVMHSTTKLLGLVMAHRMAPHLDRIVSKSQSAFIKGQSIHNNFRYVQGAIKHFHHSQRL
jgi:hypothetical protein